MPGLLQALHDEIDALEGVREEARSLVVDTIRDNLKAALGEAKDIGAAMVLLAQLTEDELTDRTTEWFRLGVSFAARRVQK